MNNQTVQVQATNPYAVMFSFAMLLVQRFVFWFGTVFGVLAAFKLAGFLPGLFE